MTQKPTICLNMIVKNESKIIKRCLDSVKHLIDSWCIVDTGSTDGTQAIIREVLQGIPGELIERPWVNFGHNRNEALRYAERWADWILLTDADMVLVDMGFQKETLNTQIDGYDVIQENHSIRYYNFRLLNSARNWQCVGVTHEYYTPKDGLQTRSRIDNLWFNDVSDGGSKSDKFERDIRLLTQGLIDEPENYRYMFYLGQSYRDIQQWDKAIEWYQKCADISKWDEEAWYSDYMVGYCMRHQKRSIQELEDRFLKAWMRRPWRNETIYSLAEEYRNRNMWHQAYAASKVAATTDYPKQDVLFVTSAMYEGGALDLFAVAAYWSGHHQEAIVANQRLLQLPYGVQHKTRVYKNIWHTERAMGKFSESGLNAYLEQRKQDLESQN
jgi:glycosyltransferase involved in cell wall biosynthesis